MKSWHKNLKSWKKKLKSWKKKLKSWKKKLTNWKVEKKRKNCSESYPIAQKMSLFQLPAYYVPHWSLLWCRTPSFQSCKVDIINLKKLKSWKVETKSWQIEKLKKRKKVVYRAFPFPRKCLFSNYLLTVYHTDYYFDVGPLLFKIEKLT